MARVDLSVRCTYEVSLDDVEVPDDIAEVLVNASFIREGTEAYEWLSDHIKEDDAWCWDYDVYNVDYVEEEGGKK